MNNLIKKILIVSDTHGKPEHLKTVFAAEQYDALIFCGDGEGDERNLSEMAGCPAEITAVRGNNDFNFGIPFQAVITEHGHRIFAAHGHTYSLYNGLGNLEYAALEKQCDICIFGHTHKPFFLQTERMVFMNPGSISEPRQDGGIPTCAVLEVHEGGYEYRIVNALDRKVIRSWSVMNN